MNPALPESDLLALIEGDLAPERARELHDALSADPELRRLVDELQRDRTLVRASIDREASRPALGLAQAAIAQAQREPAPAADAPRAPVAPHRLRIGPVLSLAAAAAIVVLAVLVFWPAPRQSGQLASGDATVGPPAPEIEERDEFRVPAPREAKQSPSLPGLLAGSETTIPFTERAPAPSIPSPIMTRAEAERKAARDQQLKGLFGGDAPGAPPGFDDFLADAARGGRLSGIEVGGMDLGRAAELAVTARLRIVVESSNPEAFRRSFGYTRVERRAANDPAAAEGAGPGDEALSINFPMDPDLAGLQDALARVAESIEGDGDALVRFEEVPAGEELSDATLLVPSTQIDDVVWWRLPADRWNYSSSVAVPIEFVTPQSTDAP